MAKAKPEPTPPKADLDAKDPVTQGANPGDKPPAPDADEMKGKTKAGGYICLEPVKHKGRRHLPGDPIDLTKAEAGPLIEQQAVAVA